MSKLIRTDDEIVFDLGGAERLLAFHFRTVHMPVANLRHVEVVDDIWTRVRGVRPMYTWIKDRFCVGTRRGLFGKDFIAVYGLGKGVSVDFAGGEWARFVATVPYPEETAALLRG